MQKVTTKWDPSQLLKMEKWKNQNNATAKETAAHFSVDTKGYVLARQRHLISKGIVKRKSQAEAAKLRQPTVKTFDLNVEDTKKSGAIALILIKPDQLQSILGDLWE